MRVKYFGSLRKDRSVNEKEKLYENTYNLNVLKAHHQLAKYIQYLIESISEINKKHTCTQNANLTVLLTDNGN